AGDAGDGEQGRSARAGGVVVAVRQRRTDGVVRGAGAAAPQSARAPLGRATVRRRWLTSTLRFAALPSFGRDGPRRRCAGATGLHGEAPSGRRRSGNRGTTAAPRRGRFRSVRPAPAVVGGGAARGRCAA